MRPVIFDATRLFIRGSRFSPTGIDRVVLAYARWLLARSDVDLQPVITAGGSVWRFPRSLLTSIVEGTEIFQAAAREKNDISGPWPRIVAALQARPDQSATPLRAKSIAGQLPSRILWHANVAGRSLWRLRPARPMAGTLYVNVSHTGLGNSGLLPKLASRGVHNVLMVHDLIPIEYPEYCAPGASARHIRRMDGILGNTSLVIANSRATADSLTAYAKKVKRPVPSIKVVPLGIEPDFLTPPPPLDGTWPYFVCVGTIEARKNLAFLLASWRRLAERMGPAAPRLVLVGRRGWENEAVLDQLHRSEAALRLVHEVSDLQDVDLARLVGGARALLAPSFAEGFDLPVCEALSLRTPVFASDIPVHHELASAAKLIDPLDGPAWLDAIENAGFERGPAFSAPTWQNHFAMLEGTISGGG